MATQKDMLDALRQFQPGDTSQAHYDAWAPDYERDLLQRCGYSAHVIGARAFAAANPDRGIRIIDVGCGTGLVGAELRQYAFTCIDGLDISADMMAQAAAKQVYRRLIRGDLMAGAPVAQGSYDAAICVGSFAPGHLGPAALGTIARLVRPGGCVVIVMNAAPFIAEDYAGAIQRLVEERVWAIEGIDSLNYMAAFDRPGKLILAWREATGEAS